MVNVDPKFLFCTALAAMTLAACSAGDERTTVPPKGAEREFSDEDKRVARALSISQNQAVMDADSPYARALLCANSIQVLGERFQNAGGLSEQQRQAIEQARTYFDEQVRIEGGGVRKSTNDISSDLDQVAKDNPDVAENARIAMACLQKLQEAN